MAKQIYRTLLGFAALSILGGAVSLGFYVQQNYYFNLHQFMLISSILLVGYLSHALGGFFLKD